jgi:hypothetical protein
MGLGFVWVIGLGWILFDCLGMRLFGRVCRCMSFMRYRYACEVFYLTQTGVIPWRGWVIPMMRDGILFVDVLVSAGTEMNLRV